MNRNKLHYDRIDDYQIQISSLLGLYLLSELVNKRFEIALKLLLSQISRTKNWLNTHTQQI